LTLDSDAVVDSLEDKRSRFFSLGFVVAGGGGGAVSPPSSSSSSLDTSAHGLG
jgi:hypothetical protein